MTDKLLFISVLLKFYEHSKIYFSREYIYEQWQCLILPYQIGDSDVFVGQDVHEGYSVFGDPTAVKSSYFLLACSRSRCITCPSALHASRSLWMYS